MRGPIQKNCRSEMAKSKQFEGSIQEIGWNLVGHEETYGRILNAYLYNPSTRISKSESRSSTNLNHDVIYAKSRSSWPGRVEGKKWLGQPPCVVESSLYNCSDAKTSAVQRHVQPQ